jgi:KDO2-lipid IV(A) lauroyltransferase
MIRPPRAYLTLSYLFARTLPRFWIRWQNRLATYLIFRIWTDKRHILQQNLSVIRNRSPQDPEVIRLARRTWLNYGIYLVDYLQIYRIPNGSPPHLIPEQRGSRHIIQALEAGNGAILITPHLGNWELGGVTFALQGCPIHALTLMDPEQDVQDYRDRLRATLGIRTIHLDPARYETALKLVRLLRENRVIAMLGDRWEGGKKVEVTFFNRRTSFPAGAPALALASGAPIIPVFTVLNPNGRYLAWMEDPIRVERKSGQGGTELIIEKTQEIATVFERVIARYPDQWYHFFDYWERYGC